MEYFLDWKILGFAGHVARMGNHRLPNKIMRGKVTGGIPRIGAPPKSHKRQREQCLRRKSIEFSNWMELAADKMKWRTLIKNLVAVPKSTSTKKNLFRENWELKPELALGRCIEKQFKSKFYTGAVTDTDIDVDTNEAIWGVHYDDGETEDFNARQLKRVLCEKGDELLYDARGLVRGCALGAT